jgi:hypothetical protein
MKNTRIVKIKTWDKMEKEFGLTFMDIIDCKNYFNKDMEEELPKNRIITLEYYYDVEDEDWFWKGYIMDNEMIEEELNPKDYPQYFI